MSFSAALKYTNDNIRYYLAIFVMLTGFLYSQDPPPGFEFEISINQSFYFFQNSFIDGESPEIGQDWLGSFNEYDETMSGNCINIGDDLDGNEDTIECQDVNGDGILSTSIDVCVGSFIYSGEFTTVPVMGNDGTVWTSGYMYAQESYFDCSSDGMYCANLCNIDGSICSDCSQSENENCTTDQWPDEYNNWSNFAQSVGANGQYDLGEPFIDSNFNGEYDAVGGIPKFKFYDASENLVYDAQTSVLPIYPFQDGDAHYVGTIEVIRDCNNDLGGEAFFDDCNECTGGNTGLEPNYSDIGCGCNEPLIGPFFEDIDGDGLGFGEAQYFCSNPGIGWSENNNDPHPSCSVNYFDCSDQCGGNAQIDDCGICSGGTTGNIPNEQIDCNNECFGTAFYDECDECVGGSTGNEPCDFVSEAPEEFSFNQSTLQAFYFIITGGYSNGDPFSTEDWVGVFNGDICVGHYKWDGPFTTIPAMGDEGSEYTQGYLQSQDLPTFKVYDASAGEIFDIDMNQIEIIQQGGEEYSGWQNLAYFEVTSFIAQTPDCNGVIGGDAFIDDCGICSGGSTDLLPNADIDCSGVCYGAAIIDNCGICSGGTTNNIPNEDDLGCGCFLTGPSNYYADVDNDGFGFGNEQPFCEDPGDGWTSNSDDLEPFCYNQSILDSNVDECGICFGGNEDVDCLGVCFGSAVLDDCGDCNGDNSSCQSPLAESANLSTNEDENILIQLSGSDPNSLDLSYIIIDFPLNGNLEPSENESEYIYTPNSNYNGQDSFTYVAFNGSFFSNIAEINLQINPINDAPNAENIIVDGIEDIDINIELIGNDIDGDDIIFNILDQPLNGTILFDNDVMVYTPDLNFNGTDQITYVTNDGQLDSELGFITIFINPVNDPPNANEVEVIFYEDNTISFTFDVEDVDNSDEELSIFVQDEINFGIISISSLEAIILPNQDINGDFYFTYQVLDGELFSDPSTVSVQILPINDPPEISNILNQEINEDEVFYYEISANDVDSQNLVFDVNDVENSTITIDGQTLIIEPDNDYNGELLIEVSVSDDEFLDFTNFVLNILPVNDPPVISPFGALSTLEDESLVVIIDAIDIDGDELIFWTSDTDNAEIDFDENQITITPDLHWNGELDFLLSVTDGEYIDSQILTIDVIPVNDSPVISTIINQFINEDSPFVYNLEAIDVDGDDLSFSLDEISNATFTLVNNSINLLPDQDFNGQIEISVSVSDGELSDSTIFSLDVLPVNDPPILEDIADQEIDENQILELNFTSFDVDEDVLFYDYYILSGYAQVEISNNEIVIMPNENWFGEIEITLTVTDGEFYDQDNFVVQVIEVDDPPTAYDITSTGEEDQLVIVPLIATDPDTESNQLTYSINSSPSSGTAIIVGSNIEYTSNSNYNGSDQLSYIVNDGNSNSEPAQINLDIIPINDPPTAIDAEYSASNGYIEFDLNSIVSDVDGDELEISFITQNYGSNTINTLFNGVIQDLGGNIFSYTPPSEVVYFDFILYKATDGVSESSVQTLSFNLLGREMPRNMAPIAFDQDVSLIEDQITDITLIGFDVLNSISENASFEIISNPSNGELSSSFSLLESGSSNLVQWSIEYTPNTNYFGEDSFTYKVTNPDNSIPESEYGTIYINISPQNDAPQVYTNIFDQTLLEDSQGTELSLDLFFLDVDNDNLQYTVNPTREDIALINVQDNLLSINPYLNKFSTPFSVILTASDGELDVSQSFEVEILPVNDSPTVDSLEYSLNEDGALAIVLSGDDVDFDPLSFSLSENPINGEISFNDNVLTYQPFEDFNGFDELSYKAFDGESYSDAGIITLNIIPINDGPVFEEISDQSINEDDILEFTLLANDIDGDNLTFDVTSIDNVESYNIDGSTLTISPLENMNGQISVQVEVSDGSLIDSEDFILNIIAQPDAPEFIQISNQQINEDENLAIFLTATDVDGDELLFNGSSSIDGTTISIDDNLMIVDSPDNFYDDMIITVVVTDQIFTVENSFIITYTPQPDAPVLEAIGDQTILESEPLAINISAFDPDGDELELSVNASDDINSSIDDLQLTLEGGDNINGDFEIIISVTDGIFIVEESFILTIINVNDPPISVSQNIEVLEDNSSIIILEATDPDFDSIEFFINEEPSNGTIVLENGLATYIPDNNYNGQDSFSFYAFDGELNSNISIVSINISAVNDGPIITSSPLLNATEDLLYTYQVTAEDPENDQINFELDTYPEGMSINESGLISWIPVEGQLTSDEVVLTISDNGDDGALPFTQTFTIVVEPVNDTPLITSNPPLLAYEDEQYNYQIEVEDPDSDIFYYTLLFGPNNLELSNSGLITWIPTEGIVSSGTVAFVVWDTDTPEMGVDFPAIQEFVIEVIEVNDPPTIVSTPSPSSIEDIEYSYQIEVEDIDDELFYYELLENPLGMVITSSGLLTWTPTEGVLSSGPISIKVYDGQIDESNDILYDVQNFALSVTAVNDAPIITSVAPTNAIEGEEYIYQIEVEDPDDIEFTYLLINEPEGMNIDFETGTLTWIPDQGNIIYQNITLKVQDGGEDFVSPAIEIFSIQVEEGNDGPSDYTLYYHQNSTLVSFSSIPENNLVESIFPIDEIDFLGIVTEGQATSANPILGWTGNLFSLERQRGYWIKAEDLAQGQIGYDTLSYVISDAVPTSMDLIYDIHENVNLLSYVGIDGLEISEALPDSIEDITTDIIGEGVAASKNPVLGWIGSLTHFHRDKGYWLRNNIDGVDDTSMYFSWHIPDQDVLFSSGAVKSYSLPEKIEEFSYTQSSKQAFYFINKIKLDDYSPSHNDWIIAYNNDIIVGARKWNGRYTDIPAMGYDGSQSTIGYCKNGDYPTFKLYIENSGELVNLDSGNIEPWEDLLVSNINQLNQTVPVPDNFEFSYPYPNPFNPSTLIKFAIPDASSVKIEAYDINGRHINTLLNKRLDAGYHDYTWKPSGLASGIYLINVQVGDNNLTHKVMFVK